MIRVSPLLVLPVAVFSLLFGSCSNGDPGNGKMNGDSWVNKTIDIRKLQNEFPGGMSHRLLLDIYPVKKTEDTGKKDFDLVVSLRDDQNKETFIDSGCNEDLFRKETAYYVHYLFHNKIPLKDIPHSYLVDMEQAKIGNKAALLITIPLLPAPGNPRFAYLKENATRLLIDSVPVCPCPPGGCTGCPARDLKNPTIMESTLKKQYANN
jgi:hypothetical protein